MKNKIKVVVLYCIGKLEYLGKFKSLKEAREYWSQKDTYCKNLITNDLVRFIPLNGKPINARKWMPITEEGKKWLQNVQDAFP